MPSTITKVASLCTDVAYSSNPLKDATQILTFLNLKFG